MFYETLIERLKRGEIFFLNNGEKVAYNSYYKQYRTDKGIASVMSLKETDGYFSEGKIKQKGDSFSYLYNTLFYKRTLGTKELLFEENVSEETIFSFFKENIESYELLSVNITCEDSGKTVYILDLLHISTGLTIDMSFTANKVSDILDFKDLKGFVYVLPVKIKGKWYLKIGITGDIKSRVKSLFYDFGTEIDIKNMIYFPCGLDRNNLEYFIKNNFKEYKASFDFKFKGYTEIFSLEFFEIVKEHFYSIKNNTGKGLKKVFCTGEDWLSLYSLPFSYQTLDYTEDLVVEASVLEKTNKCLLISREDARDASLFRLIKEYPRYSDIILEAERSAHVA